MFRLDKRLRWVEAALWLFVIVFSLQMGAGLYEMCVVTPLWSNDLPDSIRNFNRDERFFIDPRENFWRFCTPAVGLTALAALLFGWRKDVHGFRWILAATLPVLALIFLTYIYFAPVSMEIFVRHGEGMSDAQLIEKANHWLLFSRVRAAIYVCAWLASLKALSVSAWTRSI